ncbi:hypothetical protein UFOVP225_49 [uncultured Caudovirales phage]|uniref:Uncharacterized protein n=1 Tax=uncultured Caudovirales phage TaxID=2100421 RepID=A0A6J5L505_9CAUD|nr:hypothetical protein UFOVP113_62 [uncultured Caudovirales phage]CAB5219276.1 hypothetical protein UFOVP225_49 [uncultured Caudovirales phage]
MARPSDVTSYGTTILPSNDDGQRNIFVSTAAPTSTDGQNGDVWIVYA